MWKSIFGACLILGVGVGVGVDSVQAQFCADALAERTAALGWQPETAQMSAIEDEYLVGDWDGDGCDNLAVRRGNEILMDTDYDGSHDLLFKFGTGAGEDEYIVGNWDSDACDEIAVRRGNDILMDEDMDGLHDRTVKFGTGDGEDEYVIAELNGDFQSIDDISVRRGNVFIRDLFPWDGAADGDTKFGGKNETEWLVGHWDPDDATGRQTYAVRRGNEVLMNYNFDGSHDFVQKFGKGDDEDEYLVGDWNCDGLDNLAVRRGNRILMNYDFDGAHDFEQVYGSGTGE